MDLISKAYLRSINREIFIASGMQVMPETTTLAGVVGKIISVIGATLYPIALSLLLPVFMHTIVLEKEERLREIMKMSGLKMSTYWVVNYLWCFGLYFVCVLAFMLFGRYVLKADFFTNTSLEILGLTLLGWGLSQVSLSVFFQNFISQAKTASSNLLLPLIS